MRKNDILKSVRECFFKVAGMRKSLSSKPKCNVDALQINLKYQSSTKKPHLNYGGAPQKINILKIKRCCY